MKISNRDVKIFFLGFATLFIIESIYDWDSTIGSFKRGWDSVGSK
ncbi:MULTISPECIES: hypothetical protein [Flavobacterium]|jgi:hypothetical protein|nr:MULTISPECIES: hypothetical protein [Flavobacterium]MDI5887307.1 hypothetical protein [Flavobacterium yafengii]MDI5898252.1 hypothetical protein [Flavobacterium yafengii]MDI6046519.1 hypothetical protein [Flavobacterium yafengii]MDI6049107.1 hypothetical protein [Flavobacterium sp. XS2P24]